MKPSFETIYMNLALSLSERSSCIRLKVGCVITSTDFSKVYGIGYNGNAKGFPNTCDSEEVGNCGCLHAEDNALLKVNVELPKIIFITHQPCLICAKRIVNKENIKKCYYLHPYRCNKGILLLKQAGIEVIKYES